MRNKLICITISLCLIFCSVVPAFGAETITYFMDGNSSTRVSAYEVMTGIRTGINNIYNEFHNWVGTSGSGSLDLTWKQFCFYIDSFLTDGDGVIFWTWEQVANELCNDGQVNPTNLTIKEILYVVSNFIVETFSANGDMWEMTADIASTNNSIDTTTQNTYSLLNNLNNYNLQKYPAFNYYFYNRDVRTSHWQIDDQGNFGDYTQEYFQYNSTQHTSVLDYIVGFLSSINYNQAIEYNQLMTDVDATLSIWDSQGDSLTQSNWTPTSAFNGLYKYLAYTQRDVARLTHVLASDDEITARDLARDNQESVTDEFINPNGQGSVSVGNIEDLSDMSGALKDNFDTGVSPSGIWAVFNNDRYNWFTTETRNMIEPQTRGANDYPTPLLDSYYNELFGILGLEND